MDVYEAILGLNPDHSIFIQWAGVLFEYLGKIGYYFPSLVCLEDVVALLPLS